MLKYIYDTQDEIPEQFRELYSEKNGKWVLTGVTGIKTQEDVDKLSNALQKERNDHKTTKDRFRPFMEMNDDEIKSAVEKLDNYEALEAKANAGGQPDETKIQQLVDARINKEVNPIKRENETLKTANSQLQTKITEYQQAERTRKIHDAVREEVVKSKIRTSAIEDALMLAERIFEVTDDDRVVTKDNVGFVPGMTPDVWIADIQTKREHWWPETEGGGAKGNNGNGNGAGNNPWSAKNWNLTEQGKYAQKHGTEKAKQMAELAGSHLGATKAPVGK